MSRETRGEAYSSGRVLLASVVTLLVLDAGVRAAVTTIDGFARVVDGDTLVINGERVRLHGVDAPESAQQCLDAHNASYPCGVVSKNALTKKVGNTYIHCDVKTTDMYGRYVSVCGAKLQGGGFEDLNAWLVINGHAVAYRQYSRDYVPEEDEARAAGRGVWQGIFQLPSEWRKSNNGTETEPGPPPRPPPRSPSPRPPPRSPPRPPPRSPSPRPPPRSSPRSPPSSPPPSPLPSPPPNPPPCPPPNSPQYPSPSPPPPVPPSNGGDPVPQCANGPAIKGNINSSGEKIYHVPGGRYYDLVRIDLKDGEKFFCTDEEAVAAGWRKSLQ